MLTRRPRGRATRQGRGRPGAVGGTCGALALDIVPGVAMLATAVLVALSVPLRGTWWWVCVCTGAVAVLLTAFNRLLLPVFERAKPRAGCFRHHGRAAQRRRRRALVAAAARPGAPAGHRRGPLGLVVAVMGLVSAHLRRHATGHLMRLRQARRQDRNLRRLTAVVMLTVALLCAGGAAISYGVVRQHDRSVTDARQQISMQGPHMVGQILSYHPQTVQVDFDHARSLATDKYRVELSTQQQAVQKAGPVRNEYWVTNSSVLTATPNEATMLMFLQGDEGRRPISVTSPLRCG